MRRVAAYMKAIADLKQRTMPSAAEARTGTDEERAPAQEGGPAAEARGTGDVEPGKVAKPPPRRNEHSSKRAAA